MKNSFKLSERKFKESPPKLKIILSLNFSLVTLAGRKQK